MTNKNLRNNLSDEEITFLKNKFLQRIEKYEFDKDCYYFLFDLETKFLK